MPTMTFTISDAAAIDIMAALDLLYGGVVAGMTPKQKLTYHLKDTLRDAVQKVRQRAAADEAENTLAAVT